MTVERICRTALVVVRTLSLCVVWVCLAISTAGIARVVWLLIDSVLARSTR